MNLVTEVVVPVSVEGLDEAEFESLDEMVRRRIRDVPLKTRFRPFTSSPAPVK